MIHRVLFEEGSQTIYFAPRDHLARPVIATTPVYTIVDLRRADGASDRVIQAETAATPDTETETLAAAAGPGESDPTLITITDASDFTEGREYLLTENGLVESFVALRVDTSNNKIYSSADLQNNYTTSATVRAFELKATFPSAEAADESEVEDHGGPYQVTWGYTANGQKYLVPETVWIGRYSVAPLISAADVLRADPVIGRQTNHIVSISSAIAVATDDFIGELEAAGLDPVYYRSAHAGRLAVRTRALEYLYRWMQSPSSDERADLLEDRYRNHVDNLTTGKPPHNTVSVDRAHDDAPAGSDKSYNQFLRRS